MALRAKVVGITVITSTNMPLGRDGPMVHIGAMCAAILTRAKIPCTGPSCSSCGCPHRSASGWLPCLVV